MIIRPLFAFHIYFAQVLPEDSDGEQLDASQKATDIKWDRMIKEEHFRITTLNAQFLDPITRPQSLTYAYLLEIK